MYNKACSKIDIFIFVTQILEMKVNPQYNTKEALLELYNKPLLELVFEAATVHRQYHNPREVQMSSLLSNKRFLLLSCAAFLINGAISRLKFDMILGKVCSGWSAGVLKSSQWIGTMVFAYSWVQQNTFAAVPLIPCCIFCFGA